MFNITDKLLKELSKLEDIAKKKGSKLNLSTVLNILREQNFDLVNLNEIYTIFDSKGIELVTEDVEIDNIEDIDNFKIEPFDQTKIDISMRTLTLDLIIKRLKNKEINLIPDFQRKGGLWNDENKSRLIESLMLRIPLPAFYFDGSNDEEWLVIDGLQRLTAINEFFVNKEFKLKNLEFILDFEDCTCDELPRTYVRRMEETQVIAFVINPGTPSPVKYNIFKRINTSGLQLEPQEIRHALYQGPVTNLLKRLSANENFLCATGNSIRQDRMQDRELILRFLAFREKGVEHYEGGLDDYLNSTMELINSYTPEEIIVLEERFDKAMKLSCVIFGDKAFRKMFSLGERKNPINKALFESWSVLFSLLSDIEINKIEKNKDGVVEKFLELMNSKSSNFASDINSGKAHAVKRRFSKVEDIIREVLNR